MSEAVADVNPLGEDVDAGKLFEVPRVAVAIDMSDPNVLKLAFSGSYELDRGHAQEVAAYNRLRAGEEVELALTLYVAGARKRHRRDSEGDVDAVVETKSLVVTGVYLEPGEEM